MKLTTRIERGRLGGYHGRVICKMHNDRWLWSERCHVERVTRADAQSDAEWLKEQHRRANAAE